ncbi:MAG TPA: ribosome small subunit-dependent GTPase A [Chryseolinea sp.]|nr:ribosome small subunit-dependent GTPase A [Chryseolinea sp.]
MITLNNFGWNNFHEQYSRANNKDRLPVGRVISIKGFKYHLISSKGEIETELSGKLLFGTLPEDLPKIGDWVFYMDYDTMGYVIEVLPRKNELARKNPGAGAQRQILATNLDCAFIVQGLDNDFNLMRLERYMVQLAACNIKTVVVLNKTDLVTDPEAYRTEVLKLKRDCPVFLCSTFTGHGIDDFIELALIPGETYVLIGSSGVGKSSLLNRMLDLNVQRTSLTSESTNKGRHTTTSRDLFKLPNGSLVIDTPGMREFGVTHEIGQQANEMFPAINKLASSCRFADCTHVNELGCAVVAALSSGALDSAIYNSYIKLMKEQRRFEISAEDKKRLGKQSGRMSREASVHRRKNKY